MPPAARIAATALATGIAALAFAAPAAAALPLPPIEGVKNSGSKLNLSVKPPVCNGNTKLKVKCPIPLTPYKADLMQ